METTETLDTQYESIQQWEDDGGRVLSVAPIASASISSVIREGAVQAPIKKRTLSGGIQRWEHQDLLIPMNISVNHWRHSDYVGTATLRAQPLIAAALAAAARIGWQADEPIDFATLFSRSQVRTRNTFLRWHVDSVTIRLIRPFREEHLIPHD